MGFLIMFATGSHMPTKLDLLLESMVSTKSKFNIGELQLAVPIIQDHRT